MDNPDRSLLASSIHDFRLSWKKLAAAAVVYKVIAFVLLVPLAGVLFRLFVAISGRTVLADQDILFFFLGPIGWITLVVAGAVSIAIVALEQAALMTIAWAATQERRISVRSALYFTAKHAWPVLKVTARMVALGLLMSAPFLVAAGLVYLGLLTKYDINYYLSEKPPVFWIAAGLIGGIVLGLAALLVQLVIVWGFALPLLLFEGVAPRDALRLSRERTTGHRRTIALWVVGWVLAVTVLSAVGTGMIGLLGRVILPYVTGSLTLLALAVGGVILLWSAVNFVVALLTATTLAVLLVNLYRKLGSQGDVDIAQLLPEESPETAAAFRISRRAMLGIAVAGVVLAAVLGTATLHSIRLEDHTEITAHRGASAAAPENTLAAVQRAIDDGADWVEIDVQETADGVVVVVHDSDLKKLGGVDLKIWEATAAQLREVDIGSRFAPEFSDQRVPTLDEVLVMCKGKIGVNIELKYYGHDERLEERVVKCVEARGMESDIVVMSLKLDAVRKIQSLRPEWKVGLLTAVAVGDLTKLDVDFLAVSINLATADFIGSAHRDGKEVYVWTVNDAVTMSTMMGRGVDSIITDEPAIAKSVLEQRARMSSPERLLIEVAALFGARPESNLAMDDF